MTKSTTVSVRLDRETRDKLEALARTTRRSKSFLAAEAISSYVEVNAWQVEGIAQAIEKADRGGPFVTQGDAERYLEGLARGEKPERPKTSTR